MTGLGALTSAEVPAEAVLLVPLGSTEQHGPHLPLDTDTRVAIAVCDAVAARRADVVVAPALPYGSAGEHAGFAGTLSIGQEALELVLLELVRSADAFAGVLLVSGHGGNAAPLARAVATLRLEGRRAAAWVPRIPGGDAHAGRTETSLMLRIAPDAVRADRAEPGATEPLTDLMPRLVEGGIAAVSPNGILGDPTGATAAEGDAILATLVADLDRMVGALA